LLLLYQINQKLYNINKISLKMLTPEKQIPLPVDLLRSSS